MSASQWIRKASLIVGDSSNALDLSDLRFRFVVRQQDTQTPNNADIRVYNVSDATAKQARAWQEGGTVVIQAGYGGNFGTIFRGSIIQVRVGKESPVDSYIDITAGDGDLGYTLAKVAKSFAAGSSVKDHIAASLEAMAPYGVTRGWMPDDLPAKPLPRGKVMFGLARDCMETSCRTASADWTIRNGALEVIDKLAYLPGDVVVLTSATGLVGFPEQQIDGVHARALMNPAIVAGRAIQIDNRSVQEYRLPIDVGGTAQWGFVPKLDADGYYRALVVEHRGDTRGHEWHTEVIGVALADPVPVALLPKLVIKPGV